VEQVDAVPLKWGWPEWLAILCLLLALVALVGFGGLLSPLAFVLAASMGWTRSFRDVQASGRQVPTDRQRLYIGLGMAALGIVLWPDSAETATTKHENASFGETAEGQGAASQPMESAAVAGPVLARCDRPLAETDVAVRKDVQIELRREPDEKAATLPWKGNSLPATISDGLAVRQICASGDWSLVQVLGPAEFNEWRGWVPASALRKVKTGNLGRRVYVAADFDWPEGSRSQRNSLLKVINRIAAERPDCRAIDTVGLVSDGAGPGATFSIPCFTGNDMLSFSFRAADASNGRSFAPVAPRKPLDKTEAFHACEAATKQRVRHPSTVDMSLWAIHFQDLGQGKTQLRTAFKAKNSVNLELEFEVMCDFFGRELADIAIVEAS
jgi:hypothetical protein